MPRRREVPKRKPQPDPKHGDVVVGRFVNVIMRDGKKSTAERIIYELAGSEEDVRTDRKGPRLQALSQLAGSAIGVNPDPRQVTTEARLQEGTGRRGQWLAVAARLLDGLLQRWAYRGLGSARRCRGELTLRRERTGDR